MRAVLAGGLHGNVIVLLKVDPSVAAGEQLTERERERERERDRDRDRQTGHLKSL